MPADQTPSPSRVTMLLEAVSAGDSRASEKLLPLVYKQLRKLAQARMNKEARGHTLEPTALVHEAYLRLVDAADGKEVRWENRGHFFAAAALAMRRILVDRARRKGRIRHGGDRARVDMDDAAPAAGLGEGTDLLALDEALAILEREDTRRYNVVMLRYFAGLSIEDTAAALAISPATVKADWTVARVRLFKLMQGEKS
jgi:RNA polymerase sigma factor (TIGR02999 family)